MGKDAGNVAKLAAIAGAAYLTGGGSLAAGAGAGAAEAAGAGALGSGLGAAGAGAAGLTGTAGLLGGGLDLAGMAAAGSSAAPTLAGGFAPSYALGSGAAGAAAAPAATGASGLFAKAFDNPAQLAMSGANMMNQQNQPRPTQGAPAPMMMPMQQAPAQQNAQLSPYRLPGGLSLHSMNTAGIFGGGRYG